MFVVALSAAAAVGQTREFEEVARFSAAEAHQGVAVDAGHVYAIASRAIGKYDKSTHKLVARWEASDEVPLVHLNSGVVVGGKLYCAHSNYPAVPETSSIEIWDAETLEHVGAYSFGVTEGSLTWIDRYDDAWWVVFAHYEKRSTDRGTQWTRLVKLDDEWRAGESWVFPTEVIERFRPSSNSGGSFGPDGLLYCTGHDHPEVYVLRLPRSGSELELVETVPVANPGQGVAWDRTPPGMLYGIHRGNKEVVLSQPQ